MMQSFRIHAGLAALSILAAAFVGCGSDGNSGSDPGVGGTGGAAGAAGTGGGSAGTAGTGGGSAGTAGTAGTGGGTAGTGGGTGGTGGSTADTRMTISGDVTWDVAFDADALGAGATDCEYTRHYEGVQDQSKPWVCTECEVIFRTTVQMTAGMDDCYAQISDQEPLEEEWVGYGNGTWYRTPYVVLAASDQGTATNNGTSITTHNDVADLEADLVGAGTFGFGIDGAFALGEEDGDPNHGWVAPDTYSCGWKKANPAPYAGDYALVKGETLPDGLMRDKCDEVFRLHDYKGSYVVVFLSALDCPACKSMAADEPAFVEQMATKGIDVATITIMQPSLDDPFGDTPTAKLGQWSDQYGIETPVVADRGLGLFMFLPVYPEEMGYPSWIVADPDLKVITWGSAVDWAAINNAITADAQ
jgi:peroxiredoxin